MKIKKAKNDPVGVHTFYVVGDSGNNYDVVHVTRLGQDTWTCTCKDFVHRRQQKKTWRACKHIKKVKEQ